MERREAEKRKEKATQYNTNQQGNTQVEGRENISQERMFVRHVHFTGRKQEDYNILKEKDYSSLCVHMQPYHKQAYVCS